MSNTTTQTSSGGIGFFGLLTVAFVVLKLTHFITWSWWWVLAPLWMPITVMLAIVAIYLAVMAVICFAPLLWKRG